MPFQGGRQREPASTLSRPRGFRAGGDGGVMPR